MERTWDGMAEGIETQRHRDTEREGKQRGRGANRAGEQRGRDSRAEREDGEREEAGRLSGEGAL